MIPKRVVLVASKANVSAQSSTEAVPVIERRTVPRYDILQRCFVWPHASPRVEPWRSIVYNISSSGLGITMPFPPQPGTIFQVEAWGLPGARTLEVRVLRTTAVEFLWFCGCEFTNPLPVETLRTWIFRMADFESTP
jgi:hypothetical protein